MSITLTALVSLRPEQAVRELQRLKAETEAPELRRSSPEHVSWKAPVETVMARSLGENSAILREFRDVR
jgi:hypothetical protein